MSSSYYALCASHTPAITIDSDLGRDAANHLTTRDRFREHDQCDILIERVSGGIVEIACPGTQLPGPTGCKSGHRDTEWVDVGWLRLLTIATSAPNQVDPELLRHISTYGCWTPQRMTSLRGEIGVPEATPDLARETLREVLAAFSRVTSAGVLVGYAGPGAVDPVDFERWHSALGDMRAPWPNLKETK